MLGFIFTERYGCKRLESSVHKLNPKKTLIDLTSFKLLYNNKLLFGKFIGFNSRVHLKINVSKVTLINAQSLRRGFFHNVITEENCHSHLYMRCSNCIVTVYYSIKQTLICQCTYLV